MDFISIIILIAAAVFIQGWLYRKFTFKNFKYNCFFSSDEVYEGDEIEFTEEIINAKFLPLPWLKTELTTSKWLEFSGLQSPVSYKTRFITSFFSVKSYSKVRRVWKVKCLKRGCYGIENIVLVVSDILGINKLSGSFDVSELTKNKITVLPSCAYYEDNNVNISKTIGDIFVKRKLISDPFFYNGIREYTSTDPFSKINWFATAKEQQLMVHKNDFTSDRSLTVILNIQSSQYDISEVIYENYVEECIRICAAIIKNSSENGISVRILSNTTIDNIPVDDKSSDSLKLYRTLASLQFSIYELFDRYVTCIIPKLENTEIIIISSYLSDCISDIIRVYPDIHFVKPDMSGGEI